VNRRLIDLIDDLTAANPKHREFHQRLRLMLMFFPLHALTLLIDKDGVQPHRIDVRL
jgi:hypothetical protein